MADNAGEVTYPDPNGARSKETITNGPMADSIKTEASRAGQEFRDLKSAKVVPSTTTATGQPLTCMPNRNPIDWEQPRATAASFASVVTFIFAARYLPLLRWFFKFLYVVLGFAAAFEIGSRVALSQGLTSSFRPRKYYTVPKETIEAVLEDFEQLIDFILIEFQRILFAENAVHTVAAFGAAFSAYWLIKILPFWGLSLLGVTIAYLGPLVYIINREVIDAHVENVQQMVNSQAHQLKDMAEERTSNATVLMKQYVDDYSQKAQEYIGHRLSVSREATKPAASPAVKREPESETFKPSDFPDAPKNEPVVPSVEPPRTEQQPLMAA
ncbi:Reticulon-domain-containing protein [Aspergillus egyptiacus]|nr:Reticulon-domain-containing protein [Aspergillus egyptiacus]